MKKGCLLNQGVSTSSPFFSCNTRLVFISPFVLVPLRKGNRGLECKCSFYRLRLFFSTFLIICIETLAFVRFFFLHFRLFILKLLVFVDCFVTILSEKHYRMDVSCLVPML